MLAVAYTSNDRFGAGNRLTLTPRRTREESIVVVPRKGWVGEGGLMRPATPRVCDFESQDDIYYVRDERGLMRNVNIRGYRLDMGGCSIRTQRYERMHPKAPPEGYSTKRKQVRARARRQLKSMERLTDEEWSHLYKPLEEWDFEELARGRPRNATGDFRGPAPKYITRELHERAMDRFKLLVRENMNVLTSPALKTVEMVLQSDEVDHRGKPVVPAATKIDAAKFLIEHLIGKPTQPTQTDISIKLQSILGVAMVNPSEVQGQQFTPAHTGSRGELPGEIYDAEVVDEDGEE